MLRLLSTVATFFVAIVMRIFGKRDENKTAEELLPEKTQTSQVREDAERKAEEKFGPKA